MVSPLPGEKMSNWSLTQLITTKDVFWLSLSLSRCIFTFTQISGSSDGFASTRWKYVQLITHPTNYDKRCIFHFWLSPTKMIFTFGLSLPGVGLLNIVEYTLILFSISSQVWSRHGWVKMKIMKLDSKNMENSSADFSQGKKCCTLKNWIKNRNLLKPDKVL